MRRRALELVLLLATLPLTLAAQEAPRPWNRPAADSATVVLAEHHFTAGTTDSVVLQLKKSGYYWAELEGNTGTLIIRPINGAKWEALVVPLSAQGNPGVEVFEVHPGSTGPHAVLVKVRSPGSSATLRLYGNEVEARAIAAREDRSWGIGLGLAGGFHSGYRLEPTGATNPAGGSDYEGCIIIESPVGLGGCLGVGRHNLPDADMTVTWFFIEPRLRLLSPRLLGSSRTDFGIALRIAQAGGSAPRPIDPSQIAAGAYITHHLASDGRTRGLSFHLAYQRARLGNVPVTEDRNFDRIVGGITWVP